MRPLTPTDLGFIVLLLVAGLSVFIRWSGRELVYMRNVSCVLVGMLLLQTLSCFGQTRLEGDAGIDELHELLLGEWREESSYYSAWEPDGERVVVPAYQLSFLPGDSMWGVWEFRDDGVLVQSPGTSGWAGDDSKIRLWSIVDDFSPHVMVADNEGGVERFGVHILDHETVILVSNDRGAIWVHMLSRSE